MLYKLTSINRSTNVIYKLQQNFLSDFLIIFPLIQQEHLPNLFCRHWWCRPTECKYAIELLGREESNHLASVNPTIDHLGMCSWHTMARFSLLFFFQSLWAVRFIMIVCVLVASFFQFFFSHDGWGDLSFQDHVLPVCVTRNH